MACCGQVNAPRWSGISWRPPVPGWSPSTLADRFLEALNAVSDPEGKRKIIGREFIRTFEGAVRDLLGDYGL